MPPGPRPEDISRFLDGSLADDQLPDVLDALIKGEHETEEMLDFLDLPELDVEPDSDTQIPEASVVNEMLTTRSQLYRRSLLWTFEWENPLERFARDGKPVKTTLVGIANGSEWRGDCQLEPSGDHPLGFQLKIGNLPQGCEPLTILNIAERESASVTVSPAWPQPVVENIEFDSQSKPTLLKFDAASRNPVDFRIDLVPRSTRLRILSRRMQNCFSDFVMVELSPVGRQGTLPVRQLLKLEQLRGESPRQYFEAELDLSNTDFGSPPPARVSVKIRGLTSAELRQLNPIDLSLVLHELGHSSVSLGKSSDGWRGRICEEDVETLKANRSTICGLRMGIAESEVF